MEDGKLPFLTRKQLAFEEGVTFGLNITSQARVGAKLTIRGFTKEGPFVLSHTTVNTGVIQSEDFRLPDVPIMISVVDASSSFLTGENYIAVNLTLNGDIISQLCSGSVSRAKNISFPVNQSTEHRPGGGNLRFIIGTNPAAGAEITQAVPTGAVWRIIAINATLVTNANVANRRVHLVLKNGANGIVHCFNDVDQTAGTTKIYTFAPYGDIVDREDNNKILVNLPMGILIDSDFTIVTETTNIQAGDDWGVNWFLIEEWFKGG
jgi:hypothetical protein